MKKKNNIYSIFVYFILIIVVAFLFNALILNSFDFEYTFEISLTEIIGLLLTAVLALYIAHVVEDSREKKKAVETIISNMIQSLLSECDEIQHSVYNNNLSYLQATAFSKRVRMSCQNIGNIMQKANIVNNEADRILQRLSRVSPLNRVLSEIIYQVDNPNDYMEVNNNMCNISTPRAGKIQDKLANVKKDLYCIWTEICMSDN